MSEEMKKSLRLNLEAGLRIYNRTVPIFPEQARFILNLLESRPSLEEKNKRLTSALERAREWADNSAWGGREEIVEMIDKVLKEDKL